MRQLCTIVNTPHVPFRELIFRIRPWDADLVNELELRRLRETRAPSGPELRSFREARDLTQHDVAAVLGVPTVRLSKIERLEAVDAATADRYIGAVRLLCGLRRRVSQKVAEAVRQAVAI
jgi:DNA-binding transcriptional regulator YiaG